jgi:hypothetical protein
LAGIAAGGSVSAETNSVNEGISGELSLPSESRFPETETVVSGDAFE